MDIISVLNFMKDLTPLQAFLLIGFILLAASQGWLTFQGIKLKKESKKKPVMCLHVRAGSCELIRLQMEVSEVYIQKVVFAAFSHYLDMRKERTGEDIILATDIESACYNLTLFKVSEGVKDEIRNFFRANHLAEMTDAEFELYIRTRTDQIILTMTELLDKLYFPGCDPSRKELYEYNQEKLMPIFHHAMEACLREGRRLAIKFANGDLDKYMERSDEHN